MRFVKAAVCLSVLLAISACSEKESVETHLAKAKSYIKENKVNESVIELKNAIRSDVNNSEARFLLGQTYLNQGNGVDAVKELERAQELKYKHELVIPLLARAYILTNSDDDVIALTEAAKNLKTEALTQYLAYKTLAALRSEQVGMAQSSAQLAKSVMQDSFYSLLAEVYILFSENQFEQADIIVKGILEKSADNPDALMLQGQIATAMKDYGLAAKSFQHFLSVQPKSVIVQFLLADSLLKSEQFEKAEQYADAILASVSTQPFANYIKAMVRFQSKDYAKANEHAEAALSANLNKIDLKLVAGASAFYLKKWEQTNLHLSAIFKYLPPEHQAKKMLAVSQLELGLINNINETLSDFSSDNKSDSQFIASLSYKLLELGAVDEAKALVEKNDNINASASSTARQGVLKLMMNDPSGMIDLENAVKLNPELIEAELALAFAAIKSGDIEQAKKIANKWKKEYPDKASSSNLMAMIFIKEKDFIKAEQALEESLSKEKNNIFALIELVNSARYQNNVELAKERVNNLIALYPDNEKALKLNFQLFRDDNAVEMIVSSYKQDKLNIKKALLASEALLRVKKLNDGLEILNSIKPDSKRPKKYWQLLLLAHNQQKNEEKILQTLEQWRESSPYHIEPSILLVEYYTRKKDYTRAISVINRAFEYHTGNLTLQLVKMQLLLNAKELYQAKELYSVIEKRDIEKSLKMGMEGRILLLEKKFEQAIPKLENFYQTYPSAKNAVYLASAYQGNTDGTKAIKMLEEFLVKNSDERVRLILAGLYLNNDKDKAIQSYETTSKTQPNSVVVNNNLAWLYMEKGDLDNALKYAEKAFAVAPNVANVVDTYSQILLKKGEMREALNKAVLASELSNGEDIDIQLNYIENLIANSRINEAKTLLTQIEPVTEEQRMRTSQLAKLL
jgi:putative PEP-CTERM system TPR-repeat lipoprotein